MEGEVERRSQDLTTLASRLANLVDNQAKVNTLYVVSLHDLSLSSHVRKYFIVYCTTRPSVVCPSVIAYFLS
jgi:hypothetical protein